MTRSLRAVFSVFLVAFSYWFLGSGMRLDDSVPSFWFGT